MMMISIRVVAENCIDKSILFLKKIDFIIYLKNYYFYTGNENVQKRKLKRNPIIIITFFVFQLNMFRFAFENFYNKRNVFHFLFIQFVVMHIMHIFIRRNVL